MWRNTNSVYQLEEKTIQPLKYNSQTNGSNEVVIFRKKIFSLFFSNKLLKWARLSRVSLICTPVHLNQIRKCIQSVYPVYLKAPWNQNGSFLGVSINIVLRLSMPVCSKTVTKCAFRRYKHLKLAVRHFCQNGSSNLLSNKMLSRIRSARFGAALSSCFS